MNKKLTLVICIQAIVIVLLLWTLIFYGQDEYETYQKAHEEEIESPLRVAIKDGTSTVQLNANTQKNSGIYTSKLKPASFHNEAKALGTVVTIDPLLEAKTQYVNLQAELRLAESGNSHHVTQYQRLKALNDDDKNVSDISVQDALATINADNAKIMAIKSQLGNLESSLRAQWGNALSNLIVGNATSEHLTRLFAHKNVLVQISLPLGMGTPDKDSVLYITPLGEQVSPITATYISPASKSDASGLGKTFYYSAPAESLRVGMRVNAIPKGTDASKSSGVIIPNSAVVWHDGKSWIYQKQKNDLFTRIPIKTDTEVGDGWFNQDLSPQFEIVTSGAQLLLSEEYLIKNENED